MQLTARSAFLSCLMLLVPAATAAAAPTVTEFPIPQPGTGPQGIATSPYGTLAFAEGSTDAVGFSTATGSSIQQYSGLSGPADGVTAADGSVWLTEPNADRIARVTSTPFGYQLAEYPLPNGASPKGIAADSAGNVWFTESGGQGAIGKIAPSGTITQYSTGLAPGSHPTGITAGPDGNIWFTDSNGPARLGKLNPSTGAITEYTAGLTPGSQPTGITAGPDGNLWFTETGGPGAIGRITPSGTITQYTSGLTPNSQPMGIATGPGGDLWFTENASHGAIGWITPQGAIGQVATPTVNSQPFGITQGPDGNEWFTEDGAHGQLGRVNVPAPSTTTAAATAIASTSATLAGTTNPNGFATTYHFQWGPTTAYGHDAPAADAAAGSGAAVQAVTQTLTGLAPNTLYHDRLVATNCGGCQGGTTDGSDMTFTTTGAPGAVTPTPSAPTAPTPPTAPTAPTAPVIGRTATVTPVSGRVLVRTPHSAHAEPISAAHDIPIGSVIDTRSGRVRLTTEIDHRGRVQSATAWGGQFVLGQTVARGMTTFRLVGRPVGCPASGSAADVRGPAADRSASRAKPPTLWAHDHDGRYSTRGNNSVATVRGTWWKTTETCRGTVTYVKQGIVSVVDLHTRHATLVHAGHRFLARP